MIQDKFKIFEDCNDYVMIKMINIQNIDHNDSGINFISSYINILR